jgi:hypothetical protein
MARTLGIASLDMTSAQRAYIVNVGEELQRRIQSARSRARKIHSIDAALRLVRRRLPDCVGHPTFASFVAACEGAKHEFGWRRPLAPVGLGQTQFEFPLSPNI